MSNTINHPDLGPLEILHRIGRSRVCRKADGTEVTLSSKLINKLTREVTPVEPEAFVESVKLYLESMTDGPARDKTARNVWAVCDSFLEAPKP